MLRPESDHSRPAVAVAESTEVLRKEKTITVSFKQAGDLVPALSNIVVTFKNGKMRGSIPGVGRNLGPFDVTYGSIVVGLENFITYSARRIVSNVICLTPHAAFEQALYAICPTGAGN